jgi:uncharacterized membrane protein YdbT with pleckstrin-like domain
VVVGAIILFVWWLKTIGTTLIITSKRTTLRRGILSKSTNEILHSDVRNIQTAQSALQRLFGVGTIALSSAGQSDIEIQVAGVPDPEGIKELIDSQRHVP